LKLQERPREKRRVFSVDFSCSVVIGTFVRKGPNLWQNFLNDTLLTGKRNAKEVIVERL
jgi:hypothetical protein